MLFGKLWKNSKILLKIFKSNLTILFRSPLLHPYRPNYSGTYCATAYWARNSGFRVEFWGQREELGEVPPGAVRACFKHSLMESGWSQLELESQPEYPDSIQAFAAGMLEGALTWNNIYLHWSK